MSRKNLAQPQEVPTLACVFFTMRLESIKAGRQPGSHPEKDGIFKDVGPRVPGSNQMNQSIRACLSWLEGLPVSGTKALLLSCFVHTALSKGHGFWLPGQEGSRSSLVLPGPQEIAWEPWRVRDCTTLPSPGSKIHSGWPGRHPAQNT